MRKYWEQKRIEIQFAETNVHYHNGTAKRFSQLLINTVRSIMFRSGVSRDRFESAVLNTNYLINRSVSSSIGNKTRLEKWRGRDTKLEKLRTFGSLSLYSNRTYRNRLP